MARPRTAIVLQTHFVNAGITALYNQIAKDCGVDYDVFVLLHIPPGMPKPPGLEQIAHVTVRTNEIRDPGYVGKSAGGPEWNIWEGGHVDLTALAFFAGKPDFDFYWFIEYDVRFSGNWRRLFDHFSEMPVDLLATSLRTASIDAGWHWWNTLKPPAGDVPAPDGAAGPDGIDGYVCAFMPIFRASRHALTTMDGLYRKGWTGHSEVAWPTLLLRHGCRVEDIGGDGPYVRPENRNRFYTSTLHSWGLNPGTLIYKPDHLLPRWRRNKIWHPVKPLPQRLSTLARRIDRKLRMQVARFLG